MVRGDEPVPMVAEARAGCVHGGGLVAGQVQMQWAELQQWLRRSRG